MPNAGPIAALDVAYGPEKACVACVLADSWTADTPVATVAKCIAWSAANYVPGEFYRRELPLLRLALEDLSSRPSVLVIDGYVWLGSPDAPGLGAHLHESVGKTIPVIGVAKTPYRNDTWSKSVYRGESRRPLYVTAAGMSSQAAADCLAQMHGKHRIPTLLALTDHLARRHLL